MEKVWRDKNLMKEFVEKSERSPERRVYEEGFWQWYRDYGHKELDRYLEDLNAVKDSVEQFEKKIIGPQEDKLYIKPPGWKPRKKKFSWLEMVRKAQLLGLNGAAMRLNVRKTAYVNLENSERSQTITLKSLRKAAEKLDCDLVYFLVPKNRTRLSEHVWKKLYDLTIDDDRIKGLPLQHQHKTLVHLIWRKLKTAKIRRQMGWSLR